MKRLAPLVHGIVLAASLVSGLPASADAKPSRALTSLDDARACTPLANGGFAVATGGGIALVGPEGAGRTVKVLTSLDGLPDTRVHALAEGADGLWAGTEGGAVLIGLGANSVERIERVVRAAAVHAILVPAAGAGVYLGTWGSGVLRLANKSAVPVPVPASAKSTHIAAMAEHAGSVHVAYADGPVARMKNGVLEPIAGTPAHGQALASFGSRLLVGDIEGLYGVDGTVAAIAPVDARGVAVSSGELLVATYGSGLLRGTGAGEALRAEPGVSRWVRGVAVRGASRCAATSEGLFVHEGGAWRKIPMGGLPSNDLTALAAHGDLVAVGTFDHGGALYRDGAFHPIRGLAPDETVNTAAWQGDGSSARLWLGTAHGLVRIDGPATNAPTEDIAVARRFGTEDGLPSSVVRAVLALSPTRLLVGTEDGAAWVEGERVTPLLAKKKGTTPGLESPMHATWALAAAADGTLFIGTAAGLYYGKADVFRRASVATGDLKDDWVTALAVKGDAARSDVFVGTYSGGVTHLVLEKEQGLRATHLGGGYINPNGLTLRGGTLLASTMDGLLARAMGDSETTWQSHPEASTGRDVTASQFVGNTLWVTSRRGIAITRDF